MKRITTLVATAAIVLMSFSTGCRDRGVTIRTSGRRRVPPRPTVNTRPPSIAQVRPGLYVAGIPSNEFEYFAAARAGGRQRQRNWCWAACIQMTLNYHGLYVTQEQVVHRIFGAQVDRPGTNAMILRALSGWAPDTRGRYSSIYASTYILRGSTIVRDLANRWPLIVGLRGNPIGHAFVLTAVYYRVNPRNNEPIFTHVVLRDPWPSSPSRQVMPWNEFIQKKQFMSRVYVRRH